MYSFSESSGSVKHKSSKESYETPEETFGSTAITPTKDETKTQIPTPPPSVIVVNGKVIVTLY